MINPPEFYETIRSQAVGRWEQLEGDPELAAPWHQLFKQVQSPRHVLSELLQNADDAEAKNAWARIENEEFIFEHDGVDFEKEHFASLCKFGYSNKRNLHTIGFRGIGFKSTFSLGDEVHLLTPTLSVLFRRKRFTEPLWDSHDGSIERTQVRVQIKDGHRRRELEKNFKEWVGSSLSLLFFRNIQKLTIQDVTIRKLSEGLGPIAGSEWIRLSEKQETPFLLIRSGAEPFPQDALEEIREDRMSINELQLPPCHIDVVVGSRGPQKLFVVLPTGIETKLPFSCNAPFVQDPGRVKIREAGISPTNRWLLARAGRLAAEVMLAWLEREDLKVEERCRAYMLFPDVNREDGSLEGSCATICEEAFESAIEGKKFLLTDAGTLVGQGRCIAVPGRIYDIWEPEHISVILDQNHRPLLSPYIQPAARQVLVNWKTVEEVDKNTVLDVLESGHIPKPETWQQLLLLWDFVSDEIIRYRYYSNTRKNLRIVPVQEKEVLYSGSDVVRVGEKKQLPSPGDWDFLSNYFLAMHQYWPQFLAEKRRIAGQQGDKYLQTQVENAYQVLSILNLGEASDVSRILAKVTDKFFGQEKCTIEGCVRLAQIAACLNASVSPNFQYVTINDGYRLSASQDVVADVDRDLDLFVDEKWYKAHTILEAYEKEFKSCTEAVWNQWVRSERSQLLTFISIKKTQEYVRSRSKIKNILKERGVAAEPYFPYVTHDFKVEDWDFAKEHWAYWRACADQNPEFWGKLFKRILRIHRQWGNAISAHAVQVATTGSTKSITSQELIPEWIMKFRNLPCLQDSWGHYREPAELLRRTPETEALLDIEPFVRSEFDTEQNKVLLIKLGVRDTPTGPDRLLDRIRALAQVKNPPFYEVEKWYHRMDKILPKCSTEDKNGIKTAFAEEKMIFSEGGEWVTSREVFLDSSEEDVPGLAVIHSAVRNLELWEKIGVAPRPTVDLVSDWLKNIPSGKKLTQDEFIRVRTLLSRYPEHIWQECRHWINLEREWVETKDLAYRLTMQSLIPWADLFPTIKSRTADFQRLSAETCQRPPFSKLPNLGSCIEEQIQDGHLESPDLQNKQWMKALGDGLGRVILDDQEKMEVMRKHASRLAETVWQPVRGLEAVPYIEGTPAGRPRKIEALWADKKLYVEDSQIAKLFKAVSQELARPFIIQEIADAVKICIERSEDFVIGFLEENFNLIPLDEITVGRPGFGDSRTQQSGKGNLSDTQKKEEGDGRSPEEKLKTGEDTGDLADSAAQGKQNGKQETSKPEGDQEGLGPQIRVVIPRPSKPKFVEIYAEMYGFKKAKEPDRFRHPNGSWLQKSDSKFPWEKFSSDGRLVQSYWVKDHCIWKAPLQLDATIWSICEKHPDEFTLVLADKEDRPVELTGKKLKEMIQSGALKLYAAEYRLACEEEDE